MRRRVSPEAAPRRPRCALLRNGPISISAQLGIMVAPEIGRGILLGIIRAVRKIATLQLPLPITGPLRAPFIETARHDGLPVDRQPFARKLPLNLY